MSVAEIILQQQPPVARAVLTLVLSAIPGDARQALDQLGDKILRDLANGRDVEVANALRALVMVLGIDLNAYLDQPE